MKLHTLIGLVTAAMVFATCGKSKFSSTPILTFKKVSTTLVPSNGSVLFTFEFTDAEGDISDSIGIKKISSSCAQAGYIDTAKYQFPSIPQSDDTKGTLTINLTYPNLKPTRCFGGDTIEQATFRFWIKDKAGHISDTADAP